MFSSSLCLCLQGSNLFFFRFRVFNRYVVDKEKFSIVISSQHWAPYFRTINIGRLILEQDNSRWFIKAKTRIYIYVIRYSVNKESRHIKFLFLYSCQKYIIIFFFIN